MAPDVLPPSATPSTQQPSSRSLPLAGEAPLLLVWGGIGFTRRPVRDLRQLYMLHKDELTHFLEHCDAILAPLLVADAGGNPQNVRGGLMQWMTAASRRSPATSMAISSAVITILQVARYVLLCRRLAKTPGELARSCSAFAGHSLGLWVATSLASAESWDTLYARSEMAIVGAYHGIRCAEDAWDQTRLVSPAAGMECMRRGEGSPSPMLSIVGIDKVRLRQEVDLVNQKLPAERKLYLALVNGPDSFVAAGGPEGLVALCARLRAPALAVPQRDVSCSLQFIPAGAPFHTPHLTACAGATAMRTERFTLHRKDLLVPVWELEDFLDAHRVSFTDNFFPLLPGMITPLAVDWPTTMARMGGKWQVLDLGPGGSGGIGSFVNQTKPDPRTKVYVVLSQDLVDSASSSTASVPLLTVVSSDANAPAFEHATLGERHMQAPDAPAHRLPRSKFKDMIGLPRVLVAGMTPTTCDVDLVAAVMNAGYYAEFATGGYHDARSLETAIVSLASKIPSDRLITLNLIYANPRALAWMVPQIASLVRRGCPIGGITIGAGVPDPAVVDEWITTLELSYIGFKPSSTATILQVLAIARAHPTLPVMLQWTGGRAGGHHSRADFHQPVLETYQAIREVHNVILVGGSGFGDAESSWPYISGDWSQAYGRPPMPFDATLIGTRIMTTREAKTSPEAKRAMVEATGVPDEEWAGTLEGGAGGAISVISHLGESMHVLATRGMLLWAEFDKTLFGLPKAELVASLEARRGDVIARLNRDHQKVWFGWDYESGKAVDLGDMTYISVLRRLLDLVHPPRTGTWMDPSYQGLVDDWVRRIVERFASPHEHLQVDPDPRQQLKTLASKLPDADHHLLSCEDYDFFTDLCRKKGRKPVPFIPVLDAEFPVWFKKDPLWQSENLEATFHGDVGRLCILAGPVALKHCVEVDVPVATCLRRIEQGYVDKERALGLAPSLRSPVLETNEILGLLGTSNVFVEPSALRLAQSSPLDVNNDLWLQLLGSKLGAWGRDLFGTRKLVAANQAYHNPLRRIFAAQPGTVVNFSQPTADGFSAAEMYAGRGQGSEGLADAKVSISGTAITVLLPNPHTANGTVESLELKFEHRGSCIYAPISEVPRGIRERSHDFIAATFFGSDASALARPPATNRVEFDITREDVLKWMAAVDGQGPDVATATHLEAGSEVPIEYVTVPVMTFLWQLLLAGGLDVGKLLHRRTQIRVKNGQRPLAIGDHVLTSWHMAAIQRTDNGLHAETSMHFFRDGVEVVDLYYHFFVLDTLAMDAGLSGGIGGSTSKWSLDLSSTAGIKALLGKPWLQPIVGRAELQPGLTVDLELRRNSASETRGAVSTQRTNGKAFVRGRFDPESPAVNGANIELTHTGRNATNTTAPSPPPDTKPLQSRTGRALKIAVPRNSVEYSYATRDFNPNHTLPAFARYSNWREPIVQGNQTAALVLKLVRQEVPGASASTLRRYEFDFQSVVHQGDVLAVSVKRSSMRDGWSVFSLSVQNELSEEMVLSGTVELAPPATAFLFTGQGSQFAGMGLDLIEQSRPARLVWAEADGYFEQNWGRHDTHSCPVLPES